MAKLDLKISVTENIVEKARIFATAAHAAVGQKRKYTGEDYIVHPIEVCAYLFEHLGNDATDEMLAAALLHDVVEDTKVSLAQINEHFGSTITKYVYGLTNASTPEDGPRSLRKQIDKNFLSLQCEEVQTIKLADLINNTSSIVQHDSGFAWVYIKEKAELLQVLTRADQRMIDLAKQSLIEAEKALEFQQSMKRKNGEKV